MPRPAPPPSRLRWLRLPGVALLLLFAATTLTRKTWHWRALHGNSPHKVFVILGFHANFSHSWRGDTPDEAGFGTDIRIVREILRTLDDANAHGLDARGYWDSDNQFTLETILPTHAPDIIAGIRRRIAAGHDEALLAPYNNGFLSAMTEAEVRAALRWAVSNPWGSGVRDLYGSYTPILRPQEGMFTPGLVPLLEQEGIRGVILAYSSYPFTTFSNFVTPLPPAQRFGLTWLRTEPGGPRMLLFPCVSPGDVIDFVSLEKWMLELRELQVNGSVDSDMVIHINFDADAESWLPLPLAPGLGWVPNTGGLREYIDAVNKYDWARFSTPGEYVATHQPIGEVVVQRDTADGAWDGYYSWSEKLGSQELWTTLEQSRLLTQHFAAFAADLPRTASEAAQQRYFDGRNGAFYQQLRTLSTTHFGMSTPVVNEERYAAGTAAAGSARAQALAAVRAALRPAPDRPAAGAGLADPLPVGLLLASNSEHPQRPASLFAVEVHDTRPSGPRAFTLVRIPLLVPEPQSSLLVRGADGAIRPASVIAYEKLDGEWSAVEVAVGLSLAPGDRVVLDIERGPDDVPPAPLETVTERLDNGTLTLSSSAHGIDSLRVGGVEVGGRDFLSPFLTYRSSDTPATVTAGPWRHAPLEGEHWQELTRMRMHSDIPFDTPEGRVAADLQVDFTLHRSAPWVIADVTVRYPYTAKHDVLATPQQKIRRLIDRRWIEVAPFQIHPELRTEGSQFLRVWKRNYLGVTSVHDLNAASINSRNAEIDSFNNHVTAAWVAVSDRRHGLLLAQSARTLASPNFAPMRLRELAGQQSLWINPFGSYFGTQMDYSHLGGNGLGTQVAELVSPALRPNGPSYNGRTQRFTLLLAPYSGDEPPAQLQADAELFFHPPALVYVRTPDGSAAELEEDVRARIAALRTAGAAARSEALPAPRAFLASPTDGALDLTWDEPEDSGFDAFEVAWRRAGDLEWQRVATGSAQRQRIAGLSNGERVEARVRAVGGGREGPWTEAQAVTVNPVATQSARGFVETIHLSFALKVAYNTLVHLLTTP